jgi:hypothetical protein
MVQAAQSQLVINEYSCSNWNNYADNYGDYEDWIEIYNAGSSTVTLTGYFLSDNKNNPTKWMIPSGTLAPNDHQVIFCSGRDVVSGFYYHTNFRLTQTKGEQILISDPTGQILDSLTTVITQKNHSRGRTTDGSPLWSLFSTPTPNSLNSSSTPYTGYAAKPTMSLPAGFYSGSVTVSLSTPEPNITIRYTTDGSEVSSSSPVYSAPITVSITTVIRARAYSCFSQLHNTL